MRYDNPQIQPLQSAEELILGTDPNKHSTSCRDTTNHSEKSSSGAYEIDE